MHATTDLGRERFHLSDSAGHWTHSGLLSTSPTDMRYTGEMDFMKVPAFLLETEEFVVRRQELSDNPSDHRAVMANAAWLQRWSNSSWPEGGFGLEDNALDLAEHIAEHDRCEALGFSILVGQEVVGSLYLQGLAELLDDYASPTEVRERLAGCQVRADLWTRIDEDPMLLGRAVASLDPPLREFWPMVVWGARVNCPELESAYRRAGLVQLARLEHSKSGREHLLFGLT